MVMDNWFLSQGDVKQKDSDQSWNTTLWLVKFKTVLSQLTNKNGRGSDWCTNFKICYVIHIILMEKTCQPVNHSLWKCLSVSWCSIKS